MHGSNGRHGFADDQEHHEETPERSASRPKASFPGGPGKESQIGAKAHEHVSVVAFVEAGELEIVPDVGKSVGKGGGSGRVGGGQGRTSPGTVFKSGDG